jgi:protein SCO1/2
MRKRRTFFLLAAAAAAVAPVGLTWRTISRPPRAATGADLPLQAHDGRWLGFYQDVLAGPNVIINFMYAECGETCAAATRNLVEVQALLGDRVGRDVFMYSITLRPEHDTAEVLRDYAERFGVGPGWLFLTGAPADVASVERRLGIDEGAPAASREELAGALQIGAIARHHWAVAPAVLHPRAMLRLINRMLPPA